MKVMISQPMSGRFVEEVNKEREEIIKKFNELHIEVIDTLFKDDPSEEYLNDGLFFMGKSIDAMAKVDAVYFCNGWNKSRGCRIEREACIEYGIKILDSDFIELYPTENNITTVVKPDYGGIAIGKLGGM